MTGDHTCRSTVDIASGVREREFSASEVIDACPDRIDARNDAINASRTVASEREKSTKCRN